MRLSTEQRQLIRAVQKAEGFGFVALTQLAKLDPQTDFIGADLRGVDFGTDDLSGFNFSRADLTGADLRRARGLTEVIWNDAKLNRIQGGPARNCFSLDEVTRLVIAGKKPPAKWRRFITELDLSHAPIENLGPLAGLTALQGLDLSLTQVNDVSPLAALTALRTLNLSGTRVSDVTPLANLTKLQTLNLNSTQVSDVASLVTLSKLRTLYLSLTPLGLRPYDSVRRLKSARSQLNGLHRLEIIGDY